MTSTRKAQEISAQVTFNDCKRDGAISYLCNRAFIKRFAALSPICIKLDIKLLIASKRATIECPYIRMSDATKITKLLDKDIRALSKMGCLRTLATDTRSMVNMIDILTISGGHFTAKEMLSFLK